MSAITAFLSAFVPTAYAQGRSLSTSIFSFAGFGDNLSLLDMMNNIVSTAQLTILPVAVAMFVVGAFRYTNAGDSDEEKSAGKDFMVGSLMGAGIVLASKAILNFIMFFVYGS